MEYQTPCKRRLIRLTSWMFVTVLLLFPPIFFSAGVGRHFNRFAVATECTIWKAYTVQKVCYRICNEQWNCHQLYGESWPCWETHDLCSFWCKEGHVVLLLGTINITLDTNITAFRKDISMENVNTTIFNSQYQPSDVINCYYDTNPQDIQLSKVEISDYYNSAIAFAVIACLFFAIWVPCEIYGCLRPDFCY